MSMTQRFADPAVVGVSDGDVSDCCNKIHGVKMCLEIIKNLKKLLSEKNDERQRAEKSTERQSGQVATAQPPLVYTALSLT